jgi:hypothetical protein
MKEKNSTWNRLNGMRSTSYGDNKRQKSFWRPREKAQKNETKKKISEEKTNDEPEQLEFNF